LSDVDYDEFGLLAENAAEAGLRWSGPPPVRREYVDVGRGRRVSALVWGDDPPRLALLHGGGQNAHTWDTVALALGYPVVALDLPGHGHSDWRPDHDYSPAALADDVATALAVLGPDSAMLVGMSLGGIAGLAVAWRHPELVRRLALVDITPGAEAARAEPIVAFLCGPDRFASFDEIVERTAAFNPGRSLPALRRGARHNSRQLPDGSWTWRWDPVRSWRLGHEPSPAAFDFSSLWPAVDSLDVPLLLVRGSASRVVTDSEVIRLRRHQPSAQVAVIDGAGHGVQGDQPLELARRLTEFLGDGGR
jgi:pimeloyl-ACP methyl ester carboxylesterase